MLAVKLETFPPLDSRDRLKDYEKYRLLFKGKHQDVYPRIQSWIEKESDKAIIYIIVNFAGLLSKISADLLFGEMVRAVVGDEESKEQTALDQIVLNNSLHTKNYEMALSSSWRGDSFYKVRFGKRKAWLDNQVIIESVPAGICFPHLNGDNVQEMTGCTIAWTKEFEDKDYLRREIHLPGKIMNELWLMDGKELKRMVPLNTIPDYVELPEQQDTGYPGLLVVHVPNWRLDDEFFGISDYYDMESLFDEINNRVSKVSRILDKHSDPKLVLPPGIMQYDDNLKRYYVEKESLQCLEVEPSETGDLPKYLVWDAQLEAAFKQIEHLVELGMMVSETSPAAFGIDKTASRAESGRALKFKLLRTLAKINRKKLYFDEALKEVLYIAQVMDVTHGRGNYQPKSPRLEWADGLPADTVEQSEVEERRITAGNTSIESSIRRLDGLDGKDLKAELKRIEDERKANNPAVAKPQVTLPAAGGQGGSQ